MKDAVVVMDDIEIGSVVEHDGMTYLVIEKIDSAATMFTQDQVCIGPTYRLRPITLDNDVKIHSFYLKPVLKKI